MQIDAINKIAEKYLLTKEPNSCRKLLESFSQSLIKFSFEFKKLESNEIYILEKNNNDILYIFDESVNLHPYSNVLAKHWIHSAKFFIKVFALADIRNKNYIINIGDYGSIPGFTFSDYRDKYTLIPDPIFVMTNGYEEYKSFYKTQKRFDQKIDAMYWRGASTGFTDLVGKKSSTWQSIARVELCNFCKYHAHETNVELDVFISNIVQIDSKNQQEQIANSNIIKESVHWSKFGNYKYQIDIDGNSNSWPGLFLKLLTSSPVLKIDSSLGFKQWYYGRLIPWYNYIPIKKDLSNLIPTINWLQAHPVVAEEIGKNGYNLAMSMTNDSEEINSIHAIYHS